MAISFVGSDTSLAGSGVTSITMDVPVATAEGDVIVALVMSSQTSDFDCTENSGTYTQLFDLYQNGSANDTNFAGFYKVQGASPDTTVTLVGRSANGGILGLIAVYRGVDPDTPIDVAVTTTGAADAGDPDCPATVTATDGAWVLACAGCSDPDAVTNPPTNYANLVDVQQTIRNCMIASREIAVAGAEDPGAYTDITADANDSWCAATVVLRPLVEAGGIEGEAAITEAGDTVSGAGELDIAGASAITEAGDTLSAAGEIDIEGAAAITEAGDSLAAAGALAIEGEAVITEEGDTLSATGAAEAVQPEEPEVPPASPPILSGGGAAYVRARLGLDTSEALLKRVRKSLGLDKDVTKPRTSETIAEEPAQVIDFSAPIEAAARKVELRETDDEEVILLLTAA